MRLGFARIVLASVGLLSVIAGRADAAGVTEVTNLANAYGNGATLNFTTSVRAGVFTTGPTSASWSLDSITARLQGQFNGADGVVSMALYSDGGSQPATLIETLGGTPTPAGVVDYTFTSSGTTLSPSTTYWAVLSKTAGNTLAEWHVSSDFSQTSPDGWAISNAFYFSEDSGASWGGNGGFAAQFNVAVVPEPTMGMLVAAAVGLMCGRTRRRLA